jgi:hypothetical protein
MNSHIRAIQFSDETENNNRRGRRRDAEDLSVFYRISIMPLRTSAVDYQ